MIRFVIRFTVRQVGFPQGVVKTRKRTVHGLNLLDARTRLNMAMRRAGWTVHTILEVEEMPREKAW